MGNRVSWQQPVREGWASDTWSKRVGSVHVSGHRYRAAERAPVRERSNARFSLILAGGYREFGDGVDRQLWAPQASFTPAEAVDEVHTGATGAQALCVELTPDWWEGLGWGGRMAELPARTVNSLPLWRLYWSLWNSRTPEVVVRESLAALAGELVVADAQSSTVPAWLTQVARRIESDFRSRFTVQALAKEVGVHPFHLGRTFKAHYGCTISRRVTRLRLEYSMRLLAEDEDPVSAIAYRAGFADQSHLTRELKKATGWTPGAFRIWARRHLRWVPEAQGERA